MQIGDDVGDERMYVNINVDGDDLLNERMHYRVICSCIHKYPEVMIMILFCIKRQ